MADNNYRIDPQKYTGKIKWLDSQGIGYILPDTPNFPELFITPLSLSSNNSIIQEGDCVKFNLKFIGSSITTTTQYVPTETANIEVINVTPFGFKCSHCKIIGNFPCKCPLKFTLNVKCYHCGLIGHCANKCDQLFKGWFFDGNQVRSKKGRIHAALKNRVNGYCVNGWSSLFCENGGVGLNSSSSSSLKKMVCVKKKEDVKKVEEVEDCFILEFDPSPSVVVDDGDGDGDDDLRSMVCVRKKEDVEKVEEFEDCFILEFDPSDDLDKFLNLSICDKKLDVLGNDDDEVSILGVKGKVACRDYPHPRHLCATHPFKKTPREIHCKMCYCYICDVPAPCRNWNGDSICLSHCYATDESPFWRKCKDLEKRGR